MSVHVSTRQSQGRVRFKIVHLSVISLLLLFGLSTYHEQQHGNDSHESKSVHAATETSEGCVRLCVSYLFIIIIISIVHVPRAPNTKMTPTNQCQFTQPQESPRVEFILNSPSVRYLSIIIIIIIWIVHVPRAPHTKMTPTNQCQFTQPQESTRLVVFVLKC